MPETPKLLAQAAIGTAEATLYTAPAAPGYALINGVILCNTTATNISVRIYAVPNGGTAATSNALFYDYVIGAKETHPIELKHILDSQGFIRASASAAGVTAHFSGVEVS